MINSPTIKLKILIHSVLKKNNWNQKELAYKLNIKPETISRWMNGRNSPTQANINILEGLLDKHEKFTSELTPQDGSFSLSINVNLDDRHVKISIEKLGQEALTGLLGSLIRKMTKKEKTNGLD